MPSPSGVYPSTTVVAPFGLDGALAFAFPTRDGPVWTASRAAIPQDARHAVQVVSTDRTHAAPMGGVWLADFSVDLDAPPRLATRDELDAAWAMGTWPALPDAPAPRARNTGESESATMAPRAASGPARERRTASGARYSVIRWDDGARMRPRRIPRVRAPTVPSGGARRRATAPSALGGRARPARFAGRVTLYGASWCGACRAAKRYMDQQRIPYRYVDVDTASGRSAMRSAAIAHGVPGNGIPLIVVGDRAMRGFSAAWIEQARDG